jgi:hypothetical protein
MKGARAARSSCVVVPTALSLSPPLILFLHSPCLLNAALLCTGLAFTMKFSSTALRVLALAYLCGCSVGAPVPAPMDGRKHSHADASYPDLSHSLPAINTGVSGSRLPLSPFYPLEVQTSRVSGPSPPRGLAYPPAPMSARALRRKRKGNASSQAAQEASPPFFVQDDQRFLYGNSALGYDGALGHGGTLARSRHMNEHNQPAAYPGQAFPPWSSPQHFDVSSYDPNQAQQSSLNAVDMGDVPSRQGSWYPGGHPSDPSLSYPPLQQSQDIGSSSYPHPPPQPFLAGRGSTRHQSTNPGSMYYDEDRNRIVRAGTGGVPAPLSYSIPHSQTWTSLASTGQNFLAEAIYDRTGFDRYSIKDKCRYLMNNEVIDAIRSGNEDDILQKLYQIFPQLAKPPRRQRWMQGLGDELLVDDVINKLAIAADRPPIFVINSLARLEVTKEIAMHVLQCSPQDRVLLADQLGLTRKSDQDTQGVHPSSKRGLGMEAWMKGTNDQERKPIVKKLEHFIEMRSMQRGEKKRGEKWCYQKLRLSDQPGLGKRIQQADDGDMEVIAAYLLALQAGVPGFLPPRVDVRGRWP